MLFIEEDWYLSLKLKIFTYYPNLNMKRVTHVMCLLFGGSFKGSGRELNWLLLKIKHDKLAHYVCFLTERDQYSTAFPLYITYEIIMKSTPPKTRETTFFYLNILLYFCVFYQLKTMMDSFSFHELWTWYWGVFTVGHRVSKLTLTLLPQSGYPWKIFYI